MTIEEYVISYLNSSQSLSGITTSGSIPHPIPAQFITVEQVGGGITDHIPTASIAVQSWAASRAEAAELNELVQEVMDSILEEDEISQCKLDSSYNFTDLSTNHPRYQSVFLITYFL